MKRLLFFLLLSAFSCALIAQTKAKPSKSTGSVNGHDWVDLGLSVKWATCNVGAKNPSNCGGYYAWGEKRPKSRYDWDNYFDSLDKSGKRWRIYKLDGKTAISPTSGHDTARENWGGTWRMPTGAECEELCNKCKWTWTSKNGRHGYTVTGPNGNSIFLPTADHGNESADLAGSYWASTLTPSDAGYAHHLCFSCNSFVVGGRLRMAGLSVRPVTK